MKNGAFAPVFLIPENLIRVETWCPHFSTILFMPYSIQPTAVVCEVQSLFFDVGAIIVISGCTY